MQKIMQNTTRREQVLFGFIALLTLAVIALGVGRLPTDAPPLEPTSNGENFVVEAKGHVPNDTSQPSLLATADVPMPVVRPSESNNSEAVPPDPKNVAEKDAVPTKLVVHISGAVRRAGVYTLKPGHRIEDAVRLAGGFKDNAAKDALNRADIVQDGDQIVIPTRTELAKALAGDSRPATPAILSVASGPRTSAGPRLVGQDVVAVTPAVAALTSSVRAASSTPTKPRKRGRLVGLPSASRPSDAGNVAAISHTASPSATNDTTDTADGSNAEPDAEPAASEKFKSPGDGTVSLNAATAEEFQKLPGIGPAMSERILQHRKEIGRFETLEQLKDIRGIGDKKFAKMLPFLRLN